MRNEAFAHNTNHWTSRRAKNGTSVLEKERGSSGSKTPMSVELEQRRDDIEPQAPPGDMKPVRTRERDRTSLNHKRDWILLFLFNPWGTTWHSLDLQRRIETTRTNQRSGKGNRHFGKVRGERESERKKLEPGWTEPLANPVSWSYDEERGTWTPPRPKPHFL